MTGERDLPIVIDDERTILIYGVRYSLGIFQHLGLGPIGSVIRIIGREDGVISMQQISHDNLIADLMNKAQEAGAKFSPMLGALREVDAHLTCMGWRADRGCLKRVRDAIAEAEGRS